MKIKAFKFLFFVLLWSGLCDADLVVNTPLNKSQINDLKNKITWDYWKVVGYKLDDEEYEGYGLVVNIPSYELSRICVAEATSATLMRSDKGKLEWELLKEVDHLYVSIIDDQAAGSFDCKSLNFEDSFIEVYADGHVDRGELIKAYDYLGKLINKTHPKYQSLKEVKNIEYLSFFKISDIKGVEYIEADNRKLYKFVLSNPSETQYELNVEVEYSCESIKLHGIETSIL